MDTINKNVKFCEVHQNYPAFFIEYSEKGIEFWGCHLCAQRPANHNRLFIKAIDEVNEIDIIYNMPPLNGDTYEQIYEILYKENNKNKFLDELETIKIQLIQKIEQLFKKLACQNSQNQDKIISTYNNLIEKENLKKLMQQSFQNNDELSQFIINKFQKKDENTKIMQDMLREINFQKKISKDDISKLKDDVVSILQNISDNNLKYKDFFNLQTEIIDNIKLGNFLTSNSIIKFDTLKFRKTSNDSHKINLIDIKLTKYFYKQSFIVKIINQQSWIGIGVCNKQKAIQSGFSFASNNAPFCTILSSNGYRWYVADKGAAKSDSCFQFKTNDVIQIIFDQYQLVAKKMNDKLEILDEVSIPIEQSLHEELCPCIVLTSQNDEVQFLE